MTLETLKNIDNINNLKEEIIKYVQNILEKNKELLLDKQKDRKEITSLKEEISKLAIDNFNKQLLEDTINNINRLYDYCLHKFGSIKASYDTLSKITAIQELLEDKISLNKYQALSDNLELLEKLTDENSLYWKFKKEIIPTVL